MWENDWTLQNMCGKKLFFNSIWQKRTYKIYFQFFYLCWKVICINSTIFVIFIKKYYCVTEKNNGEGFLVIIITMVLVRMWELFPSTSLKLETLIIYTIFVLKDTFMEPYLKSIHGVSLFLQYEQKEFEAVSITKIYKIHFKISPSFVSKGTKTNLL